ncbi:MAG: hypothetical protein GEU99_03900 [Luteitalea sp.]|nr:hypothetical protein [Luteitalea sp.]
MTDSIHWDRRSFLKGVTLAAVGSALDTRGLMAVGLQGNASAAEFGRRLRGPIVSIPTPFDSTFNLDFIGLRRMIAGAQAHGIETYVLTAGDSQYSSLSYDEIKQLARAIDFARFAESAGATALQVLKPGLGDDENCVEHYRKVAASTRLPIVLHGNFSMELLEKLIENPSIVALKEDVSLAYYIDTTVRFGTRLNCFSGGGLHWFKVGQPYGSVAYFDSFATFAPDVSARFWKAVTMKDEAAQVEIIRKYDHPWIKNFSAAFWHATLEHFGVAQRYLRPPQPSYTDAQMAEVKAFHDRMDLAPSSQG